MTLRSVISPLVLGLLLVVPGRALAQEHDGMHEHQAGHHDASDADRAAIQEVVDAYHAALASGDRDAVDRLLADEVVVLESGGSEDRAHYMEHHLPGDMAFAGAVERQRSEMDVKVMGDVAWVSSTSTTLGTYRDREIDSVGAELMVLARMGSSWRIHAIHWSSRAARRD